MDSETAHNINNRDEPDDDFYTPRDLAQKCIDMVPFNENDTLLDCARGHGAFYDQYPDENDKDWCEIKDGRDYLEYDQPTDWVISNPPYSNLDDWIPHTLDITNKGFAFLLRVQNITPRRLEYIEEAGFGMTSFHMCKVFDWYGMTGFFVFEKNEDHIIDYDRTVWRHDG
jgi:type I restriction-modification system DNA methylase subunit